jgi:hypothetical protein
MAAATQVQASCVAASGSYTNGAGSTVSCVNVSGSFTGHVSNAGTITPGGISLVGATISGNVYSSGDILANEGAVGISLDSASKVSTSGTAVGVEGPSFTGGIVNSGAISAAALGGSGFADGIGVVGVTHFTGGVQNLGTINTGELGVYVDGESLSGGVFDGGITNGPHATISGLVIPASRGIELQDGEEVSGGITNAGTISNVGYGILVERTSLFSNGITNTGLITAQEEGIHLGTGLTPNSLVVNVSTFTGGIVNSGAITTGLVLVSGSLMNESGAAAGGDGISVRDVSLFSGGINNDGGTINANSHSSVAAIAVSRSSSFDGGIFNSGSLYGTGPSAAGIAVYKVSAFSGGISNNSGAVYATGTTDAAGIAVQASSFSGGISNTGTVTGTGAAAAGIAVGGIIPGAGGASTIVTFAGGIQNENGIFVNTADAGAGIIVEGVTNFTGGISNTGLVSVGSLIIDGAATEFQDGIVVALVSSFAGGISNGGSITTNAATYSAGIQVLATSVFDGGVTNTSTITTSGVGIEIGAPTGLATLLGSLESSPVVPSGGVSTFFGNISNTGTIIAGTGIAVLGSTIHGAIIDGDHRFNEGTGVIQAANHGILIDAHSTIDLESGGTAIFVNGPSFSGGITNAGTIYSFSDGSYGDGIGVANVTSFGGGIANSGTVDVSSSGIYVYGVSTFTGGIVNSGSISGPYTGVQVDNSSTFSGGISNSGSISSSYIGIEVGDYPSSVPVTTERSTSAQLTQSASSGQLLAVSSFTGGIVNSGTITAAVGIDIGRSSTVSAASAPVQLASTGLVGSSLHYSSIGAFAGGVSNSGSIIASQTGIAIGSTSAVTPTLRQQSLSAAQAALAGGSVLVVGVSNFSGGVANTGTIASGGIGVSVGYVSTFSGGISNSGTITAPVGISIGPGVTFANGGIVNSGTIRSSATAIDTSAASSPVTINQAGGSISGDILLSSQGDTVNITGGAITGAINGNPTQNGTLAGTVNFNLGASGTFTTGGTISVDNVNVNSGTLTLANNVSVAGTFTNNATLNFADTSTHTITPVTQVVSAQLVSNPQSISAAFAFVQSSTGVLSIQVTAQGGASLLNVAGAASVAGGVKVFYAPGTYAPHIYTFLAASGGLTGTFSTLGVSAGSTAPSNLTASLAYTADDANLVLSQPLLVAPTDPTLFSAAAFAFSQFSAQSVTDILGRTLPHGGGNTFYNLSSDSGPKARGWLVGTGNVLEASPESGAPSFHADAGGLEGGVDLTTWSGGRLGAAVSYQSNRLHDADSSSATQDEFFVGAYGSQTIGWLGLSAVVGYSNAKEHFSRAAGVGFSTSSRNVDGYEGAIQASAPFEAEGVIFTPAAGVLFSYLSAGSFGEANAQDADFAVSGGTSHHSFTSPYVQLGVSRMFKTSSGLEVTPDVSVGYRYDATAAGISQVLVASDGTVFGGNEIGMKRDSATVGASLTLHQGTWTGFVRYNGAFANDWGDNAFQAGLRVAF